MKTVLIVDDEKFFLASLTEGLTAYADEFAVLAANNGRQAIDILESQPVELVVTDLSMPVMDGFQLLAYILGSYHLPVIVMTAIGSTKDENHFRAFDAFWYFEKPIDFQALVDKIRLELARNSEEQINCITLFNFIQLLEMEKRTCALRIRSKAGEGFIHLSSGEMIGASCGDVVGEPAASQIIRWEDPEIEIMSTLDKIEKRIYIPLQNLLMETARFKDDSACEQTNDEQRNKGLNGNQNPFIEIHHPIRVQPR